MNDAGAILSWSDRIADTADAYYRYWLTADS
jgi:hypothetical protein